MPRTEIEILGQKYVIKGDATEAEMKNLAAFVDRRIKEVLKKSPGTTPLNAAILAALNIAGELEAYKKEHESIARDISEKASALSSLFE